MSKYKHITVLLFLLSFSIFSSAQNYLITDFGAVADSKTLNTKAIQLAIDKANQAGGGKVIVPNGEFLTGSIVLKTGVELHLSKNAVLLGSINPNDYKKINRWKSLVLADGQNNIAITGEGTIDGQGQELALYVDSLILAGEFDDSNYNYRRRRPNEKLRPEIIEMVNCKDVVVSGITVKDGACWIQTYDKCMNLLIDRIRVDSDVYWNNDGMDISDCKNVRITNCFVNSADDGICLKSHTEGHFNDNILIANCTIRSSASAIKFGTASKGGFKNVTIENIRIYDTYRSALAFEAVDGGIIENVTASNIVATNTGNAIFIKLGHRNREGEIGSVKNITIKNMVVDIPFGKPDINYAIRGPELTFFHNPFPASISGLPGHNVENVTLENIEISFPGRANKGYAHVSLWNLDDVPEVETSYPEFSMFGELPSWGFYVRHVDGLKMKNVRLNVREDDFRPAYVFDDVKNLKIEGGNVISPTKTSQLVVKDVQGVEINNFTVDWKKLTKVPAYGENVDVKGVELLKSK